MGVELLLKATCREMKGIMRNFYWVVQEVRHMFLEASHLKQLKALGSLGFRHVKEVNESLFLKFGWRIINNQGALWVQTLKAKYFARVLR